MAALASASAELSPLAAYMANFTAEDADLPFLFFYQIDPSPTTLTTFTRGEFLHLSRQAASILSSHGLSQGDHVTHYFSGNSVGDLAFRFAAVLLGVTPVTVNWQADSAEKALFKFRLTKSKLFVVDKGTKTVPIVDLVKDGGDDSEIVFINVDEELLSPSKRGSNPPLPESSYCLRTTASDSRIVIFTSGTTGDPKGVCLPYSSYVCNASSFDSFLAPDPRTPLLALVVNPMHHTNSTAITDWCLRRPGANLHLVSRYSTDYWRILTDIATPHLRAGPSDPSSAASLPPALVCPLVSLHLEYLSNLYLDSSAAAAAGGQALPPTPPVPLSSLSPALAYATLLLGSAPVGPSTIARVQQLAQGSLPAVRFGSTETCLQVCGTPLSMSPEQRLRCFERGWGHVDAATGAKYCGYYIGRGHHEAAGTGEALTEVAIVKGVDPADKGTYMVDVPEGTPGYIITRGNNLLKCYCGLGPEATAKVLRERREGEGGGKWYTNLGDVGFALRNDDKGVEGLDYYWLARDSDLLIRGGANYSFESVNADLAAFLLKEYGVVGEVAVCGSRARSEHEDDCWATVELPDDVGEEIRKYVLDTFVAKAKKAVGKGSKPDRVRIAKIPRNFKGAILVKEMLKSWESESAAGK